MLVRSGIILIKYWFSVSGEEQERRFQDRMKDPTERWKSSPMELESTWRRAEYSRAKDERFAVTDIKQAPRYVGNAENKKCARLNVIGPLLSMIDYRDLTPEHLKLPPLDETKYVLPPIHEHNFIPQVDIFAE
jgi:polyphosphate kinase